MEIRSVRQKFATLVGALAFLMGLSAMVSGGVQSYIFQGSSDAKISGTYTGDGGGIFNDATWVFTATADPATNFIDDPNGLQFVIFNDLKLTLTWGGNQKDFSFANDADNYNYLTAIAFSKPQNTTEDLQLFLLVPRAIPEPPGDLTLAALGLITRNTPLMLNAIQDTEFIASSAVDTKAFLYNQGRIDFIVANSGAGGRLTVSNTGGAVPEPTSAAIISMLIGGAAFRASRRRLGV